MRRYHPKLLASLTCVAFVRRIQSSSSHLAGIAGQIIDGKAVARRIEAEVTTAVFDSKSDVFKLPIGSPSEVTCFFIRQGKVWSFPNARSCAGGESP